MFKFVIETVLGLTLGAAALFLVVAHRRFRRFPVFWVFLTLLVLGVSGTSYILFFSLLHLPVGGTFKGWAYVVAQALKVIGILGLVFTVTKYRPEVPADQT